MGLIGQEAAVLRDSMSHSAVETPMQAGNADVETREHHIESSIESDPQFSDTELVNLTVLIGAINAWNRIAIGFRAVHPVKVKAAVA